MFRKELYFCLQLAFKLQLHSNVCDVLSILQALDTLSAESLPHLQSEYKATLSKMHDIEALPNVEVFLSAFDELRSSSSLRNLNVVFNPETTVLWFENVQKTKVKSRNRRKISTRIASKNYDLIPRIKVSLDVSNILQIWSNRNLIQSVNRHQIQSDRSLARYLHEYIGVDASHCEGVQDFIDVIDDKIDHRDFVKDINLYSVKCQSYFDLKDRKQKGQVRQRRCAECQLLQRRCLKFYCDTTTAVQRAAPNSNYAVETPQQIGEESKCAFDISSHATHNQMTHSQLVQKCESLKESLVEKKRQLQRAQNEIRQYRRLLHLDDIRNFEKPNNNDSDWILLWNWILENWNDIAAMYAKNPLRLEFDFDQWTNRIRKFLGKPTANKWSRGSILFWGQVAMKTGLFKHLKKMDFQVMPDKKTIALREIHLKTEDGVDPKHFESIQLMYNEYCDRKEIAVTERHPFFIQTHDEVTVENGMHYNSQTHKIYGITSALREQMQIISVFEIFRGIATIQSSHQMMQTLFIDLNSGFEYLGFRIGTASGMKGHYLHDFCIEILNGWYINTPWRLNGYVSDLGAGNLQLIMDFTGNVKFMDDMCLEFESPVAEHSMFYLVDSTHALKNGRTAMKNSDRLHEEGPLRKEGNIIDWTLPLQCWNLNEKMIRSGHPVYFQNIFRNVVHPPNNWALQKVNYVLPLLQSKFHSRVLAQIQKEPPNPAFVGCECALEYLKHLKTFAECAVSFKLGFQNAYVNNLEHPIFEVIEKEKLWWNRWRAAAQSNPRDNRCVADATYFAIVSWYSTYPKLVREQFAFNAEHDIERYTCPFRVTQNGLESVFGQMKYLGGCRGGEYDFMIKKVSSKKQSMLLCDKISAEGTKKGHYQMKAKKAGFKNKGG